MNGFVFTSPRKLLTRWAIRIAGKIAKNTYARKRGILPAYEVDRLRVYGSAPFTAAVIEGLSQLKRLYPYGYSLVQRYVDAVVQNDSHPGIDFNGVIYRQWKPGGKLPFAPNRLAADLVGEAVGLRRLLGFSIWRPRSRPSSVRELHAMKLLGCESHASDRRNSLPDRKG